MGDLLDLKTPPLKNIEAANLVMSQGKSHLLSFEVYDAIEALWAEPIIKEIYENRSITSVHDTARYFWDSIPRIRNADYLPTNDDILLCRGQTTDLRDQRFHVMSQPIRIIDVS